MPMIPQALMAAMQQRGGGAPPEQAEPGESDWLVNAINAVHAGMVQEGDPKQVSLLGAILNQLTTFQANRANAGQQGPAQGG